MVAVKMGCDVSFMLVINEFLPSVAVVVAQTK